MRTVVLDSMYRLARPALFRLDPEAAHEVTLFGLRWAERCGLVSRFVPRPEVPAVTVMGLEFPNRVGLAAGLDKAGTTIDGLGALGFGHVEVGTLTPRPQPGNPVPRLFRLVDEHAIINRMGFNNPGVVKALESIRRRRWRGVLGINIGKNFDTPIERAVDDYLACLRAVYSAADYVAVNISSPNTKGLRDLQEADALRRLVLALKGEQERLSQEQGKRTPIAVKVAPDLDAEQVKVMAGVFATGGVDAVIATNTSTARTGVEGSEFARETGGLSGAPLREMSTVTLARFHQALGGAVPLIGVGGIMSAQDARERFEAGASLVQIYTGLIYRGPSLVAEVAVA